MPKKRKTEKTEVVQMPQTREAAVIHEAGHAVMRWVCNLPPTALHARCDGSGLCEGTGEFWISVGDDRVLVSLAGVAAELPMAVLDHSLPMNRDTPAGHAFSEARRILSRNALVRQIPYNLNSPW